MENVQDLWWARDLAHHPLLGSPACRRKQVDREEMLLQHLRRDTMGSRRLRRELFFFGTTDGFVPTSDWGRIKSEWAKALLARV